MQGRRLPDGSKVFAAGDYALTDGKWYLKPPPNKDGKSYVGVLGTHTVTVHDDGTITVTPSILQQWGDGEEIWHGFLEHGVWRSC